MQLHLNQLQLSRRWHISPRTLEAWRWQGEGPPYLKLKGRILYAMDDVEAYEALHRHTPAASSPAPAPPAAVASPASLGSRPSVGGLAHRSRSHG